jgi:hypothetical protein
MEQETVKLLIKVFESLMRNAHESSLRLQALEQMLERRPELKDEYQKELHRLGSDPSASVNLQGISDILATLRARLLRD